MTFVYFDFVKEKWSVLNDMWDDTVIGLDEEVFLVRGEDKGVTCKTKYENLRRDDRCVINNSNPSQQQQPHPARRSSRMQPSLRLTVYRRTKVIVNPYLLNLQSSESSQGAEKTIPGTNTWSLKLNRCYISKLSQTGSGASDTRDTTSDMM
ncbi:hypothetical protein OUZ56_026357 [Daphnia magna]|uniref:Uncharacterized protein n=1 Tax=Daphnia magna TaxID=35525 RepID=A0ABQ9ZLH7_9CRUS|nr:hypothetical protein OUZ56_026357 [Daphnia magna]